MTRKTGKSHSVVERLLEQRRQYQDWLEKLDAEAAAGAPSHVTNRVREDYAARLESVTQELTEHEDFIRQALVETGARVEELVAERQARNDELTEARLRRQVGEFSEDRYDEVQVRCKAALTDLTKEIASNERDIERLEEVLAMIQRRPSDELRAVAPPPPAAAPVPQPPKAAEVPPPPAPAPPPPPAPAAKPATGPQMGIDELEFLRSVTETPKGTTHPSVVASAITATPPPPPPPPPPPAPPPPAPPPAPPKAPEPPPPPPPPKAVEPPPVLRMPEPPPAPAAKARERRPSETEAKTLKCVECGTMNAPTEWYCEKCGAELSTF